MKNKIAKILMVVISIGLLIGCVSETYKEPISKECVSPNLTANKTVADIWAIAINPTVPNIPVGNIIPNTPVYTNTIPTVDDIIEGYVISSDEGGNFYQSMYFQPLNKTKGFNISVDIRNAYLSNFAPGKKVFLKLNGLAYANPTSFAGGLIFGGKPTDRFTVDRLKSYEEFLIPSCDVVSEELLVNSGLTIAQAKNDIYLNTLVELKNVQFNSVCSTYSKQDADTSLKISDGISTTTIDLRTSKFANFAGKNVPSGNGTIRGVLSKFGSSYQIAIRTERDVKMTNPRIGNVLPAKVGSTITYNGSVTEDFNSYTINNSSFPKYINDAPIGSKYWEVKTFSGNPNFYLEMSAFNNDCAKSYFIIPVDMTAAKSFSFKTKDGYNKGDALKIFYSLNYVPGNNIDNANLVEITDKFTIADGRPATAFAYASTFTNSGTFNIPSTLTGNGYFIFQYDGANGVTTTIQLDDIVIN